MHCWPRRRPCGARRCSPPRPSPTTHLLLSAAAACSRRHSPSWPRSACHAPRHPPTAPQRPSKHDLFAEQTVRVAFEKATPRRHMLEPLDNCSIYIECVVGAACGADVGSSPDVPPLTGRVDLDDGRIMAYAPLPAVAGSPQTSPRLSHKPLGPRDDVQLQMQAQFARGAYFDPFAKCAAVPRRAPSRPAGPCSSQSDRPRPARRSRPVTRCHAASSVLPSRTPTSCHGGSTVSGSSADPSRVMDATTAMSKLSPPSQLRRSLVTAFIVFSTVPA